MGIYRLTPDQHSTCWLNWREITSNPRISYDNRWNLAFEDWLTEKGGYIACLKYNILYIFQR